MGTRMASCLSVGNTGGFLDEYYLLRHVPEKQWRRLVRDRLLRFDQSDPP